MIPYPVRVWTSEPYYYSKFMTRLGHKVEAIAHTGGSGDLFEKLGVHVHEVEKGPAWRHRVVQVVRQTMPDVIHVFRHWGCGLLAWQLHHGKRPALVLDVRSPHLHGRFRNALTSAKDRIEALMYDAVCSNTLDVMESAENRGGNLRYLPNGVDGDELPIFSTGTSSPGICRFVYVGAISPKRGIETLLVAFCRAAAATRTYIHLDLFGKGSPEDFEAMYRLMDKVAMSPTVRLLQPVPRQELFARLSKDYDVGIAYIPRIPFDIGPPLKTLEYLACGLPVLATNTRGNRLYVNHGENGLIIGDDPPSVERGIHDMISFFNSSPSWREACRASVSGITWERSISQTLLPLYQEVLG